MGGETRRTILETITNLYLIDGISSMGIENMLYGLFDGFEAFLIFRSFVVDC